MKQITTFLIAGFLFVSGSALNTDAAPRSGSQRDSRKSSESGFFKKLFSTERSSSASSNSSRRPRITPTSNTRRSSTRRTNSNGSSSVRVRHMVLASASPSSTRLVIDINKQKAYLLANGKIALTTPVSTARRGKYTPRGTFHMSERVRSGKISTIYGVSMPYWMRLSGTAFGVHAGYLPGYPASAGCIRLPANAAQLIFDNTRSGTRINIYSSWNGN